MMANNSEKKTGLDIFGSVMASVSHDIKNRMAVINEHAGLMVDRILMAERGGNIDIERFRQSAEKIKIQVALADEIIRDMNQFAHSIDHEAQPVALHEAAALATSLFQRSASAHEISIDVREPGEPVTIEKSYFHVLATIWMCLKVAIVIAAPKSTITITCERSNNVPQLLFGIGAIADAEKDPLLIDTTESFAGEIGAEVLLEATKSEIQLSFR
jgi:signal transduction histidine kinase